MACGKLEIRPANGGHGSKPSIAGSKSETNSNAETHASDRRDKNSKRFGHLDIWILILLRI